MRILIAKFNETQYWSAKIQAQVKAIYAYYLFDEESATYCCEIIPSHFLHWAGFDIEMKDTGTEVSEAFHKTIESSYALEDCSGYYHCSTIQAISEDRKRVFLEGAELAEFLENEFDGECDKDNPSVLIEKMCLAFRANPNYF